MEDQAARPRELRALGNRAIARRWKQAGLTLKDARDAWATTPLGRLTFRGPGNVTLDQSPAAVKPRKWHKLASIHHLALIASQGRRDLRGEVYVRVAETAHCKPATYPAFAYGCYEEHPSMLLPDFYSANLDRMDLLREELRERLPWEEKHRVGLARFGMVGPPHGPLRVELCRLSGALLDAKIARRAKPLKNREIVPSDCWCEWLPRPTQARWRYLVDVSSWEGRFWKPYSGSLLIDLQSLKIPWVTWRSERMVPGTHYLVASTPAGVLDKIQWAIDNDSKAEGIAMNGSMVAVDHDRNYTITYAADAFDAYLESFA